MPLPPRPKVGFPLSSFDHYCFSALGVFSSTFNTTKCEGREQKTGTLHPLMDRKDRSTRFWGMVVFVFLRALWNALLFVGQCEDPVFLLRTLLSIRARVRFSPPHQIFNTSRTLRNVRWLSFSVRSPGWSFSPLWAFLPALLP